MSNGNNRRIYFYNELCLGRCKYPRNMAEAIVQVHGYIIKTEPQNKTKQYQWKLTCKEEGP